MALSIIAQPGNIQPAYNPIVFGFQSTETTIPGFKFKVELYETGDLNPFATLRVSPLPAPSSAGGYVDVSKLIQNQIENKLTWTSRDLVNKESYFNWDLKVSTEYSYFWQFIDYEDYYGYWTTLTTQTFPVGDAAQYEPKYNAGDLIEIDLGDTFGDNRDLLKGLHTVVAEPELVVVGFGTRRWKLQIDIPFNEIGSGGTTPDAISYFADRRRWDSIPGNTYPDTPLEITDRIAYNEAVPFAEFPVWDESQVLPTIWNTALDNGSVDGKILTNAPNAVDIIYGYDPENGYFGETIPSEKFTIKHYQKLYWNFIDNETDLVDSLIAYTDDGRRFLLPGDGSAIMKQFDVSPTAPWINITPNTGPGGTVIDYTLDNCKFYDVFPVRQRGYNNCDAITVEFLENGTEVETYTAYVSGQQNGRRKYEFTDSNGYLYNIISVYNGPSNPNGVWGIYPLQPIPQIPTLLNNTTSGEAKGLRSDGVTLNNNVDAWLAFDGDPATYWESTGSLGQGILQYMFNDTFAIMQSYRVVSATASGAPKDWTIEVSNNGVTWWLADTVTNNTSLDVTRNAAYQAKYFRLKVTATQDGTNLKINTFQVLNTWPIANMSSASECPTSGGFLIWNNLRTRPAGITSYGYTTTTALTGADPKPTLQPHRIYLDYDCEINTTQLLFLDRQGSYSSFVFPMRIIENGRNEKLTYKNEIGSIVGSQWTYNTYDSEMTVYNSMVEKTYTLTTDWLTTGMSDYFEELITSPEVYIKLVSETTDGRDGENETPWVACTVMSSDFVNPKQKNKRLINRTITVKLNSNNAINI